MLPWLLWILLTAVVATDNTVTPSPGVDDLPEVFALLNDTSTWPMIHRVSGDYLLGFSHDPWGTSHNFNSFGDGDNRRNKRSVLHLYNMLVCATGCNPMIFKGYGCYCGFLGSGFTVDGIDRCCKMHDWCYDTANCPMFMEYFVPYLWKCSRRQPVCALTSDRWGRASATSCSQRLCECDRRLAECLRHFPCPRRKAVCTSSPWRLLHNLFML